jgi:hypothetical protein
MVGNASHRHNSGGFLGKYGMKRGGGGGACWAGVSQGLPVATIPCVLCTFLIFSRIICSHKLFWMILNVTSGQNLWSKQLLSGYSFDRPSTDRHLYTLYHHFTAYTYYQQQMISNKMCVFVCVYKRRCTRALLFFLFVPLCFPNSLYCWCPCRILNWNFTEIFCWMHYLDYLWFLSIKLYFNPVNN